MQRHRIWMGLALSAALTLTACSGAPAASSTPTVVTAPPASVEASSTPAQSAAPEPSADSASQTPAQSASPSAQPSPSAAASQQPQAGGAGELPVLIIGQSPRDAKLVQNTEDPAAGTYQQILQFDEVVTLTTERLKGVEHTESAAKKALTELAGGAAIQFSRSASLSDRLGHDAYLATYATGQDGVAMANTDVYIQTDGYDYRLHIRVPADLAENYNVDGWVESVDLFTAG